MLRGTWYYNTEIKVENGVESAKVVTNVQTFRDFALHQWNVRECFKATLTSNRFKIRKLRCARARELQMN